MCKVSQMKPSLLRNRFKFSTKLRGSRLKGEREGEFAHVHFARPAISAQNQLSIMMKS